MFDSQNIGGNLYNHLVSTTIFALKMNKLFIWALKIMSKMATGTMDFKDGYLKMKSCKTFESTVHFKSLQKFAM